MPRQRLVVEASDTDKATLARLLQDTQLSFSDWFDARLSDGAATYDASVTPQNHPTEAGELLSLPELKSSTQVLSRLRSIDWSFSDASTAYLSHGLHPYPAKFIPQIPGTLISHLTLHGELVWDPFGGSGTTALEASLRRRRAISSDANPLAAMIGKAKTTTLSREEENALFGLRDRAILLSSQHDILAALEQDERTHLDQEIPPIPNISDWFHQNAIRELAIIRTLCRTLPKAASDVAAVAFSKTILKASFQDSETRYTRKSKVVAPGSVLRAFAAELDTTVAKVRRLSGQLDFRSPMFVTADSRASVIGDVPPAFIKPESVALVVTSPPYPNANDYHLYHRFRLFWLGYDPRNLAGIEIGSHLRHQKERTGLKAYLNDMEPCLRNCFLALQAGRYAVFVIGDCVYEGKSFKTSGYLAALARSQGFSVVGLVHRQIHNTRRSFIPAARRAKSESLLVLQKPPRRIKVVCEPPPYRPWPYEDILRRREAKLLLGERVILRRDGALEGHLDPFSVDRLRQLTFTHTLSTAGCGELRTWQAFLENGDAHNGRLKKDPKYVTHGIHPYKGKFYPQLAKVLFNLAGLKTGAVILDPYCGSGTVLLEAQLNGMIGRGCDINPLAVGIANAKCAILSEDPVIVDRLLVMFIERLVSPSHTGSYGLERFPDSTHDEIRRWFAQKVITKLAYCLREIDQQPVLTVKHFLRVCLSSIIRDVSQQDPRDLRIRRRKIPLVDAPVFELLAKAVREQRGRLHDFAAMSDKCPYKLYAATASLADSRHAQALSGVIADTNGVDAVITSPPYATALPYIDTNRLSLLVLEGMASRQRSPLEQDMIGSREITPRTRKDYELSLLREQSWQDIPSSTAKRVVRQLYQGNSNGRVGFRRLNMAALMFRYFRDMARSLTNVDRLLKPHSNVFLVIGDNRTLTGKGVVLIETTKVLCEVGQALGWRLNERIPITVTRENLRHSRHSITDNTVLWFSHP